MKWTDKQSEAITKRNKNLLVSAAAGSGKTAVLVERIKQLILNEGCPIDRMLVVTFTGAAASEMKGKIEKAVRQEIDLLSGDTLQDSRDKISLLKRQLDLLPVSQISTFHSFAMEVVRKFFYTIGCEPNFKICDEARRAIIKGQAMDELIASQYEKGGRDYYDFLDKYGGDRNDNRVREMIESLTTRLESLPYPMEWLDEKTEELNPEKIHSGETAFMNRLWEDVSEVVDQQLKILEKSLKRAENIGLRDGLILAANDLAAVNALKTASETKDYDHFRDSLKSFKLDNLKKSIFSEASNPGVSETELTEAKSYIDSRRKAVKESIKDLRDGLFSDPYEVLSADLASTYDDVKYLGHLVREYDRIFSEMKRSKGLMDFGDLEHFAFRILDQGEAAEYYREKFRYIFVDEYQDSNILQEALIGKIARDNNLFTVGDVKQSIYKFRLAEPEIFQKRYHDYKDMQAEYGDESPSEKIDLNLNFRSKSSVVDFINEVFRETMEGYGDDEALYAGDEFRDNNNYPPQMFMASEDWTDDDEIDDALRDMKKTEKEALLTVKLIRDYLGKPVFDSKEGRERPLTKRDIVILMRGIKNRGDVFYKVLMENNIPCFVDDNKGYFDTIEINTFMSLMQIIDNHKQDIPLLTVMRSEIMNFSIRELAEIRVLHKEGSYYDAVKACAEGSMGETYESDLTAKCSNALRKISEWQETSRMLPLEELLWKLMLETGFYAAMGAMPGGSIRQANLRLLIDKAADYRTNQNSGLYGFIKYVDHIKEKDIKTGQAKVVTEDDDTVRIMTIHHSKGLEFPMVIISGYNRKLGGDNGRSGILTDKDLGIALPVTDHKNRWYRDTILHKIIKRKNTSDEVREEKRVLYVAMTRAKDILLMTGIAPEADKYIEDIRDMLPRDTSYFSMTGGIISRKAGRLKAIDDKSLAKVSGLRKRSVKKAIMVIESEPNIPDDETERIMNFSYPYENETRIKSKYSVSELNSRGYEPPTPVFDTSVPRVPEMNGLTAGHVGTVTHSVLEKMDFNRLSDCDKSSGEQLIGELVRTMVDEEYLKQEEGDAVDISKLYKFASCELGRRIGRAQARGELFRERPFNLKMNVDGEEALVQGVIDCWFIEDDKIVLVDYKTTSARNAGGVKERYRIQMDIYRDALVKATGLEVKESYLYLTNIGETVSMSE